MKEKRRLLRSNYLSLLLFAAAFCMLLFGQSRTAQAAALGKVQITKVSTVTADAQRVYWRSVEGANAYVVSCSTDGGTYKKVATVTKAGSTFCTVQNRKPYKIYRYQVKAMNTSGATKLSGAWSNYYEAYLNKNIAIYGKTVAYSDYGRYYKSYSASKAAMRTIQVKTWDFASGKSGVKITRTWNLTVHKNVAVTVKRVFNEIYNNNEKFPIHDLGGWRWDGGSRTEHQDGTAIDINPEENYMISNGKVVAGSFYRPGKNPYSIPTSGTVANIFKKYGFAQGLWSSSKDYMHFSYFGT